jgi:hypothetical protein
MKRAGLWAVAIVALASVGPLVKQSYAGESGEGCTLATLRGLYMFAQSGYQPVNGGLVPLGVTGKDVFHGNGAFDSLATLSIGGTIVPGDAAPGTYTVNSDCTGTVTVHMTPPTPDVHLDIFIQPDGGQFFTIETDAGTVLSGTIQRVAR